MSSCERNIVEWIFMPDYKVVEVVSRRDLMKFIKFPDRLYKDCPQYVPALHSDQVKSLTKVSTLSYCKRKMWMVVDGKTVVGRICGMINPRYNALYDKKRARFGWFDTIDDFEVAKLLLGTAEAQYKIAADQPLQEKITRIAGLLKQRYNLHEGSLDKLKKDKKMVRYFFDVYNESFAKSVYNFIPFTKEEIDEEASEVLRFVSDKTSSIIFDDNEELVGFGITFPTISRALQKAKGHLFPFGWFHLLKAMYKYDTVDLMINGAVPKWQNTGVSSIYHCTMSEKYRKAGTKWAISNPQIESNGAVNVWGKYEHELFMRRRCYLKSI